jgi:hypothetical protein
MVPFQIEAKLNDEPVSLWVEQLDYLADAQGRLRFDVRTDLRQAILVFNVEANPVSPDFTFEAMQSIDQDFGGEELLQIITAIRDHLRESRLHFNRLPL